MKPEFLLYMRITPTAQGLTLFETINGRQYRLSLFSPDLDKAEEENTLADYMRKMLQMKEVSNANLLPSDSLPSQDTSLGRLGLHKGRSKGRTGPAQGGKDHSKFS